MSKYYLEINYIENSKTYGTYSKAEIALNVLRDLFPEWRVVIKELKVCALKGLRGD